MLFVATDFVQHINICYFVQQMNKWTEFVQQINICCFVATNWICSTNEQMESPLRGLFESAHWTSVEQILFNRWQNVEHMLKYFVRTPRADFVEQILFEIPPNHYEQTYFVQQNLVCWTKVVQQTRFCWTDFVLLICCNRFCRGGGSTLTPPWQEG